MTPGLAFVTGCSSGIGWATVEALAAAGQRVFATARRVDAIEKLRGPNVEVFPLDVDDGEAIRRAVDAATSRGPIDVLINNAGYGQMGPLTEMTRDELARQFETNVFAVMELSKAVCNGPGGMIARRRGRIVMVSSVVSHVATPFAGPYCASKHALRALSDVLRLELRPFGIDVVQVEPGPIKSRFSDHATEHARSCLAKKDTPYEPFRKAIEERLTLSQVGASPASEAARLIVRAATAARPRTRYVVTSQAKQMKIAKALLPDRTLDRILARRFGLVARPS